MNLVEPILWHGRSQRDTIALLDGDRTVTYEELAELVCRTAGRQGICRRCVGRDVTARFEDRARGGHTRFIRDVGK